MMPIKFASRVMVFCFLLTAYGAGQLPTFDVHQCAQGSCLQKWFDLEIQRGALETAKQNQKNSATDKQAERPSVASSSTSLLDRTSAADLAGVALNLFSAGQGSKDAQGASPAVTVSGFALYTAATGQNPLNPSVYQAGENWRRISFTVGSDSSNSDTAANSSTQNTGKVVGVKLLLINYRDVSSSRANAKLEKLNGELAQHSIVYSATFHQLENYFYTTLGPRIDSARFPALSAPETDMQAQAKAQFLNDKFLPDNINQTLALLSPKESKDVENFIAAALSQLIAAEKQDIIDAINSIRKAPQLSFSYSGRLTSAKLTDIGFDLHRFEGIFDYGANNWTNITVNASYDHMIGRNIKNNDGARVAGEAQFDLNHRQAILRGIDPFTFALNGEANFLSTSGNIYRTQARLTIPITKGVTLPLSVTYANQTALIKESEVRGQFGFTIDIAKLSSLILPNK